MTHQEYTAAIEKQCSVINRLFKSRRNRSEMIQKITKERYDSLIGKFFKADERIKGAFIGDYYYIISIDTCSDYVYSNRVDIELTCRHFGTTQQSWESGMKVVAVKIYSSSFRFESDEDIIAFIEPMLVEKEEVMSYFDELKNQITENFLSL